MKKNSAVFKSDVNFKFACNKTLPSIELVYETYGEINADKTNAVNRISFICINFAICFVYELDRGKRFIASKFKIYIGFKDSTIFFHSRGPDRLLIKLINTEFTKFKSNKPIIGEKSKPPIDGRYFLMGLNTASERLLTNSAMGC